MNGVYAWALWLLGVACLLLLCSGCTTLGATKDPSGFSKAEMDAYRAKNLSDSDAFTCLVEGVDAELCAKTKDTGFGPYEGAVLLGGGFSLTAEDGNDSAREWIRSRFTFDQAVSWRKNGFSLADASHWRDKGFTPESASEAQASERARQWERDNPELVRQAERQMQRYLSTPNIYGCPGNMIPTGTGCGYNVGY